MKTAMQELREDLIISTGTCNKALEEIKDLRTREACQAVVKITIDNILNRIDAELLEMEKEQIRKSYCDGELHFASKQIRTSEQYYNETFKTQTIVTTYRDGTIEVETFKSE
jgi:hypothetical protein